MLSLNDSLRQINAGLARIREFRPLWEKEYSYDPVLTPEEVAAFEEKHSCRLPEEYREFLLQVGNGGFGGVYELNQHFSDSGHEECLKDDVGLSLPFPGLRYLKDEDCEDAEDRFSPRHAPGSIIICDEGCGTWLRLVITGPFAGEIWVDDRINIDEGFYPHLAPDGPTYRFLPWCRDWVARCVYQYGHKGNPNRDPGEGGADLSELMKDR